MPTRFPPKAVEDFKQSGLSAETVEAAKLTLIPPPPQFNHVQFAIKFPYFDVKQRLITDYWRIKLFPPPAKADGDPIKYLQPGSTKQYVYLPPTIPSAWWSNPDIPIIVVEGEKKALKVAQDINNRPNINLNGHIKTPPRTIDQTPQRRWAVIGLGGVDSWHNRLFKFTTEAVSVNESSKSVTVKATGHEAQEIEDQIAVGLNDIEWHNRQIYVVFDHDSKHTTQINVRRAAFEFCLWAESRGAIALATRLVDQHDPTDEAKMGADDFIVAYGINAFVQRLRNHSTFPVPVDLKQWTIRQLNKPPSRPTLQKVARAVVAALDERGQRFKDTSGSYFYFDSRSKALHDFRLVTNDVHQMRLTTFGTLLSQNFGVQTSDGQAMSRIADAFASTDPITQTKPQRVTSTVTNLNTDAVYVQVGDSQLVKITATSIELVDNGTDDQLFLAGQVEPLPTDELMAAIKRLQRPSRNTNTPAPAPNYWLDFLRTFNLEPMANMTLEQTQVLLSTLFYLSPWLRHWRGLMLPVEFAVAEPGSGKTTLYNLRRGILTGRPSLDNPPGDIKDWYSSVAAAPGIWVCDNLGEIRKDLRDRLSDEMARLVTDPNPGVDMRQYYTTSTVVRLPIDCTFAATSIWSPFSRADVLQRAVIFNLKEIRSHDDKAYTRHLANRHEWVASHIVAIQRFLQLVKTDWRDDYKSDHRLVGLEQSLQLMGRALGQQPAHMLALVRALTGSTQEVVARSEPSIQALETFAKEYLVDPVKCPDGEVRYQDVIDWVENDMANRFGMLRTFKNIIMLGRYMTAYQSQIERSCGVRIVRRGNARVIKLAQQPSQGDQKV